ncbi:MAG: hypothetical protein JWN86_530 [Planctomycetota bacterium]|nr:hypothetical protein [Planctomycetota bacterium]
MAYSDHEFGQDLLAQLDAGYDPVRIARRAYGRFLEPGERSDSVHEALIDLSTMEEGEEFHIPEEELRATADRFIASP